jgi:hypothetical protein
MRISEQLDWALFLIERSYGPGDVPGVFWLVTDIDDINEDQVKQLATGVLKGVKGISGDREIVRQFLGVARNAMLVMPGKDVVKLNKVTRVLYEKPEYLVSNNLAALYRIWQKDPESGLGRDGLMMNFMDYFRAFLMKEPAASPLGNIGHAINFGHLRRMKYAQMFRGQNPRINTVKDLAVWVRNASIELAQEKGERQYLDLLKKIPVKDFYRVALRTLKKIGDMYKSEGEWIIKGDVFKVPKNSRLLVLRHESVTPEIIKKHKEGELPTDWADMVLSGYNFDKATLRAMNLIEKYGLDKKYKLRYVPEKKFNAHRAKLLAQR